MPQAAAPSRKPLSTLNLWPLTLSRCAMKAGASDAEAVVREGDEFSVNVRMGEVETLKESGSRGLGLRVFLGKRSASASTSDLTAGRDSPACGRRDGAGQSDRGRPFHRPAGDGRVRLARRTICTFTMTTSTRSRGRSALSGRGGPRRRRWPPTRASPTPTAAALTPLPGARCWPTRADLWAATAPAMPASRRRRWPWMRTARCSATAGGRARGGSRDLESPESIGKEAARRTLRRLGARRVPTQRVPIVFAPEVARSLIGSVFEAASGDSIWRSASFLAGQLGEPIAAPSLTIVDDNTMLLPTGAGGFGTSPFDGEGLPSRRTVVVEERRAAQLPAEHLHRAQAGHEVHAQRLARTGGHAGHRLRQSLS